MTRTALAATTALCLALSLGTTSAFAQDDQSTHIGTNLASKAQLDREHSRAVAAGDWANDPYDSRSSDNLNRAQLDGMPSMMPTTAPGMASAPMTDANTGINSDMSADVMNDNTNNNMVPDDTATLPESDTPGVSIQNQSTGPAIESSSMPSTSMPSSSMPSSSSMPQSSLPTSVDTMQPQQATEGSDDAE